ncbi:MAG TPA: VOC family protein [Rhizomicrobium sp.]|jgi:predicted 3-demethylubiquinone-9 3-methyltransferase (glyoxalase superfamily)
MTKSVSTFLMFTGRCEEAINFYTSLISNSKIESIAKWGPGAPGKEGSIMRAAFTLNGVKYLATDSPPVHAFDFTPSMSLFVECDSEAELDRVFAALSDGGKVLMPLGNYGFSEKFGWCDDRFGVSWQLNLT